LAPYVEQNSAGGFGSAEGGGHESRTSDRSQARLARS
jgi:hypothetical protein